MTARARPAVTNSSVAFQTFQGSSATGFNRALIPTNAELLGNLLG